MRWSAPRRPTRTRRKQWPAGQVSRPRRFARARARRQQLDRDRDERDTRVENATADAIVALDARSAAEQALADANEVFAVALRALISEKVTPERAAALVDVSVGEVRRHLKESPTPEADVETAVPANDDLAARRAG